MAVTYAAPLLLAAAFVKSPIAFAFIVFYTAYCVVHAVLSAGARETMRAHALRRAVPFILLLIALLAVAVLAEQLRLILLDRERDGFFAQGAGVSRYLYFGTWELRGSSGFWQTLWSRTHVWGPFAFGYIYLGVAAAALALKPGRRIAAVTAANLIAFFGGWLVLSQAYIMHNYYQLPLAVIAFIAFGVSFAALVAYLRERLPAAGRARAVAAAYALAALILFSQLGEMDSLSARDRVRFWNAIEYALRDEEVVLFVNGGPYEVYNPQVGGFASTKFHLIKPEDFENDCIRYLSDYPAVLSRGESECLDRDKLHADYFIRDAGWVFYLNRRD